MTVVTFTVKDAVTQSPIAGAYCMLSGSLPSGGTVPFDGYTNSNGVANIDIGAFAPVRFWYVSASGYYTSGGAGYPPATVLLTPTTLPPPEPPPPEPPPPEPPPPSRGTYLIYTEADADAMNIILQKNPAFLPYLITSSTDPTVEPTEIAENNLILLGGWVANPYTRKYFVDTGIITYDETKMYGPGVYANGKRCISKITRANGTTVTAIFGWDAIDTIYTAMDFVSVPLISVLPALACGSIITATAILLR